MKMFSKLAIGVTLAVVTLSLTSHAAGSDATHVKANYVQVCVNKDGERVKADKCPANATPNTDNTDTYLWYYIILSQNSYVSSVGSTVSGGSYSLGKSSAAVTEQDADEGDPLTDEDNDDPGNEGSEVSGDVEENDNGDSFTNDDGGTTSNNDSGDDTQTNDGDTSGDDGDSGDTDTGDDGGSFGGDDGD
jgi:hypothetical protein